MASGEKRADYQPSEAAKAFLANESVKGLMMGLARATTAMDAAESGARAILWELRRRKANGDIAYQEQMAELIAAMIEDFSASVGLEEREEKASGERKPE